MARQKEFNPDEVLHKAMEVFWRRGYEGASMQDLVKHMGINRQSIYDTFGDKHSLFLQSLDRYREIESRKVFAVLERPGSVKKNLRQLFEEVVSRAVSAEGRRGCFVGNSMSELAGRCKATADRTCSSVASGGEYTPAGIGARQRTGRIVTSAGHARGGAFALLRASGAAAFSEGNG